jgi:acetyl esterase/lipase
LLTINNADLAQLLPTLGGFQLVSPTTTLESMRALSASRPPSALWPEVLENDIQIPVRDGTWNAARVYSPSISKQESKGRALFVFIYGGGYVVGSITSEETNARNWVKRFGGVAINISYRYVLPFNHRVGGINAKNRHAPEHQWPGPQEDIYDATKWVRHSLIVMAVVGRL